MSSRFKFGGLLTAAATGLMGFSAFADTISDMEAVKDTGSLDSTGLTTAGGQLVNFILALVTIVAIIVCAWQLVKIVSNGQRGIEEAKGKIVIIIVVLALATPTCFYNVIKIIQSWGQNVVSGADSSSSIDNGISVCVSDEETEYSVYC